MAALPTIANVVITHPRPETRLTDLKLKLWGATVGSLWYSTYSNDGILNTKDAYQYVYVTLHIIILVLPDC